MAQATFIASYAMLMFMARLQRQDVTLEEAAMDLGATHARAFRRITIPFLKPTILTASVIAFLQSFENYNTTIFAIGGSHTLVTEIGSRMRFGLSPRGQRDRHDLRRADLRFRRPLRAVSRAGKEKSGRRTRMTASSNQDAPRHFLIRNPAAGGGYALNRGEPNWPRETAYAPVQLMD